MARSKLNMDHGFMQSIIKNQVDRDNYDKEVRAKLAQQGTQQKKQKKPDVKTYQPPTKIKAADGQLLFNLEYEDEFGDVHILTIFEADNPGALARKFGSDHGFTSPMTKAFAEFLKEEIQKRK